MFISVLRIPTFLNIRVSTYSKVKAKKVQSIAFTYQSIISILYKQHKTIQNNCQNVAGAADFPTIYRDPQISQKHCNTTKTNQSIRLIQCFMSFLSRAPLSPSYIKIQTKGFPDVPIHTVRLIANSFLCSDFRIFTLILTKRQ